MATLEELEARVVALEAKVGIVTPTPEPEPAPTPIPVITPNWTADHENGWAGTSVANGWSQIQGIQTTYGPGADDVFIADPTKYGIPACPIRGGMAAHFRRPDAGSKPHAKVYKEWNIGTNTKGDQFGRRLQALPNNDPSGDYETWFYFPSNYVYTDGGGWANHFQFKEEGVNTGSGSQDPSWWLNIGPDYKAGTKRPMVFVNRWKRNPSTSEIAEMAIPLPLGRWFSTRARVLQSDRIEWYQDGKLVPQWSDPAKPYTSVQKNYPIGRFYSTSKVWIFGIGHYNGIGLCWGDAASFTPIK